MKTLTLKLPEVLETQLDAFANKNGLSKSEIVRRALSYYLSNNDHVNTGSFLDLSRDLAGSIEAPSDLSTNKEHLDGYGK